MIKAILQKIRIRRLSSAPGKSVYQPNRRNAPRAKSRNLMKCLRSDDTPKEFVANLCNLSETGLQFFSGYKIQPGSLLKIALNLAEKEKVISVVGKAAWLTRMRGQQDVYRVGVAFLSLAEEDREHLRSFVKTVLA